MKFFNFGGAPKIPQKRMEMATKGSTGKNVPENISQPPATPSYPEHAESAEALYRSITDQSLKELINSHAYGVSIGEAQYDAVTRGKLEKLAAENGMSPATLDEVIGWLADNTDKVE